MAGSTNLVMLIGRLGKDAETKFTTSGAAVTNFSVATERRFKKGDDWVSETDWHNVVLWRAEKLAEYLKKGTLVSVQGRLQTRSYEKDGEKRYLTEVIADQVGLLSSAGGASGDRGGSGDGERLVSRPRGPAGGNSGSGSSGGNWSGGMVDDSDIPF